MSGHGNFSAINSVNPLQPTLLKPDENIGVAANKSVGAVKAPDAPKLDADHGEIPLEKANDGAEKAGALLRQLDVLLARAAESATKGIDAAKVKDTLNQVNIPKGERAALNAAADKADAAFKAIDKFTGFELGAAVATKDGRFDWNMTNPAGEAIKKALDAQMELSEKLRQLVNQMPRGELADSLEEAAMQCDRRACEIQTLVCQFADILEKDPLPTDQALVDKLNQTLQKLLPQQALKMHGNDAALAAMKKTVEPLANRLDELAAKQGQGARLSNEEIAAIGREIDTMANALQDAAKRGVAGSSGIGVDRTLFTAAKHILDDTGAKLANARSEIAKASMLNFAEKTFAPLPHKIFEPKFLPILKALAPNLACLIERRDALRKAALAYANDPGDETWEALKTAAAHYAEVKKEKESIIEDVGELAESVSRAIPGDPATRVRRVAQAVTTAVKSAADLTPDEKAAAKTLAEDFAQLYIPFATEALTEPDDNAWAKTLSTFAGVSNGAPSQATHLKLMHETAGRMSNTDFLTSDTVRAAFEGKLRFTTLVEARLHGMKDEDVDPKLDDINHVSTKKRGSGSLNTVYEVGYKDGSSYIFKPEAPGRQAIENLVLANGINETQMVAQLNMASQRTADALGLDDVMVKTTVGSHKGEFGIFMEKAKGVEAEDFVKLGISEKPPAGDMTLNEIRNLPDDKYAKTVGSLMRQANRLEWFDMITGQGDRHSHNFFVSAGKDGTVSLKGIDNDACFTDYRTGIRTFQLAKNKADYFKMVVTYTAKQLYPASRDARRRERLAGKLMADPGVQFRDDGTATVDTTKFTSPILHYCLRMTFGMHTTALPDYIDKALYDKLMALAEPGEAREKYIANLTANLPEGAAKAAISRLDDAIAHAKALDKKGHVVTAEAWLDHGRQREIAGKLPPSRRDGVYDDVVTDGTKSVGASTSGKAAVGSVIVHLTEGYFRRNIMRAVAKPGWFEK